MLRENPCRSQTQREVGASSSCGGRQPEPLLEVLEALRADPVLLARCRVPLGQVTGGRRPHQLRPAERAMVVIPLGARLPVLPAREDGTLQVLLLIRDAR